MGLLSIPTIKFPGKVKSRLDIYSAREQQKIFGLGTGWYEGVCAYTPGAIRLLETSLEKAIANNSQLRNDHIIQAMLLELPETFGLHLLLELGMKRPKTKDTKNKL